MGRVLSGDGVNYMGGGTVPAAHNITGQNLTVSVWYKSDASVGAAERIICSKWSDVTANQAWMVTNESNSYYLFDTSDGSSGYSYAVSTTVPNNSVWHHIVGVLSPLGVFIYVNGKREGINPVTRSIPASTSALYFGVNGGTDTHVGYGSVARFAMWDIPLNDAEILYLYAGGNPRNVQLPRLRAAYALDDYVSSGQSRDTSPYNNTLAITGTIAYTPGPVIPENALVPSPRIPGRVTRAGVVNTGRSGYYVS